MSVLEIANLILWTAAIAGCFRAGMLVQRALKAKAAYQEILREFGHPEAWTFDRNRGAWMYRDREHWKGARFAPYDRARDAMNMQPAALRYADNWRRWQRREVGNE